jgi:FixJ family two-component response regulator
MLKLMSATEAGVNWPWPPADRDDRIAAAGHLGTQTVSSTKDGEDAMRLFRAGAKLMIVEDEFLIGEDLAHGPRKEGIGVLGPYNSIARAIEALSGSEPIGAAILDLNIHGRVAFDLAEKLNERNIPFIFYTGYDSVIIPEKFRRIGRVRKPADWQEIKRALFPDAPRLARRRVKELPEDAPALASMLPTLQRRAREITANRETAERLVERTLERAIREIAACPAGVPMEHWLIGLLETTGIGDPKRLN